MITPSPNSTYSIYQQIKQISEVPQVQVSGVLGQKVSADGTRSEWECYTHARNHRIENCK